MADASPKPRGGDPLDPAVLDRLEGLDLVARTVVEGYRAGHHRSTHRGSSVEFAEYREYVPGDELRHLDWRIFARTNRLVVKEFHEESNLDCHLLLDASESMAFGSLGWSKLDYARWGAAALAHMIIRQRDSAGLVVFDEDERQKVPPGSGDPQRASILGVLEGVEPKGTTDVGGVLAWLAGRLRRRGIIAIFSDFLDEPEKIVDGLRRLAFGGHEPVLFQVLDPRELDLRYERLLRLDGLEGLGRVKIDPKALQQAYREEVQAHIDHMRAQASALSCDHVLLDTSVGLDVVLSAYLARRQARARGFAG